MPELPDIELYLHGLRQRAEGRMLLRVRLLNPFVLRTFDPGIKEAEGKRVAGFSRLGKRIAIHLEGELHLVIHLMVAGRLLWFDPARSPKGRPGGKIGHASFEFESGTLVLTEAGSHKRASIHLVRGAEALEAHDPGGVQPLECSFEEFRQVLLSANRTLKRALTSPTWFSGIGSAYSDEILHAARLSPVRLTQALSEPEMERLFEATRSTLTHWSAKLIEEFADRFPGPGQVTAFRPDFAVHGKFGEPCPECGKPVQRIRYAENETNYCAQCQNEGRLLADRALSRLLKSDWPRTLEELEGA